MLGTLGWNLEQLVRNDFRVAQRNCFHNLISLLLWRFAALSTTSDMNFQNIIAENVSV